MLRWRCIVWALLAPALVSGKGAEGKYEPPVLKGRLQTIIPHSVKHLQIQNPNVIFQVVVDADGSLIDYLAIEATHHELLEKAEEKLQKAHFEAARYKGEAIRGKLAVAVSFFDPEQRAWKSGMTGAPMGGSVSEREERRR